MHMNLLSRHETLPAQQAQVTPGLGRRMRRIAVPHYLPSLVALLFDRECLAWARVATARPSPPILQFLGAAASLPRQKDPQSFDSAKGAFVRPQDAQPPGAPKPSHPSHKPALAGSWVRRAPQLHNYLQAAMHELDCRLSSTVRTALAPAPAPWRRRVAFVRS